MVPPGQKQPTNERSQCNFSLPVNLNIVETDLPVIGQDYQRLEPGLSDKHSIEWVSMIGGKLSGYEGMGVNYGKGFYLILGELGWQEILRDLGQRQPAESIFYGYFP